MNERYGAIAASIALGVWAGAASAAMTDIQTLSTQVLHATGCSGLPVQGQNTCFRVTVRNNGPDPYVGMSPPGKSSLTTNKLQVTVDIDEPTGPDGQKRLAIVFTKTDSFAVNIPNGGTVVLQFSNTGWVPANTGPFDAVATSVAGGTNIDNVPGNNTARTPFFVFQAGIVPGFGTRGAIVFLASLALASWWLWGRRRAGTAGSA